MLNIEVPKAGKQEWWKSAIKGHPEIVQLLEGLCLPADTGIAGHDEDRA